MAWGTPRPGKCHTRNGLKNIQWLCRSTSVLPIPFSISTNYTICCNDTDTMFQNDDDTLLLLFATWLLWSNNLLIMCYWDNLSVIVQQEWIFRGWQCDNENMENNGNAFRQMDIDVQIIQRQYNKYTYLCK